MSCKLSRLSRDKGASANCSCVRGERERGLTDTRFQVLSPDGKRRARLLCPQQVSFTINVLRPLSFRSWHVLFRCAGSIYSPLACACVSILNWDSGGVSNCIVFHLVDIKFFFSWQIWAVILRFSHAQFFFEIMK